MVGSPLTFLFVYHLLNLQTMFIQVAPIPAKPGILIRSFDQQRAIVLVHGLHLHPLDRQKVKLAELSSWQKEKSELVRRLSKEGDVFSFGYAQTVRVECVACHPSLKDNLRKLKDLGYREIILIGHSAGGLVARHFVEDHPDCGIHKVIQVCSPNVGSELGRTTIGIPKLQECFVKSLTPEERQKLPRKQIPTSIEFICVVGKIRYAPGDGVVSCSSQWCEDLRKQGIPAILCPVGHVEMMRNKESIHLLAELCREPAKRWNEKELQEGLRSILGSEKSGSGR